jgi:hypothetical protein
MKKINNLVITLFNDSNLSLNWKNFEENVLSELNADLAVLLIKSSSIIRKSEYWTNSKFIFDISDIDQTLDNIQQEALIRDILLKKIKDTGLDKNYDNFIFTSPKYHWVGSHPPVKLLKTGEFWMHAPNEGISDQHTILRSEDLRDYLLSSNISIIDKIIIPFPCIMYLRRNIDINNFSNQEKSDSCDFPGAQNLCEFYTAMSNYSLINTKNSWLNMFERLHLKGGFSPYFLLMDRLFQTLDLELNININNKLNYDASDCSILLATQNTSHLMLKFIDNEAILFDSMDDSQKALYRISKFNTLTNTDFWHLDGRGAKTLGLSSGGNFTKNVGQIVSPPLLVDLLTITPII